MAGVGEDCVLSGRLSMIWRVPDDHGRAGNEHLDDLGCLEATIDLEDGFYLYKALHLDESGRVIQM